MQSFLSFQLYFSRASLNSVFYQFHNQIDIYLYPDQKIIFHIEFYIREVQSLLKLKCLFINLTLKTALMRSFNFHSDINECNIENGGCTQNCINTPGSFACECTPEYQLGVDGKSCYREYRTLDFYIFSSS